MNKIWQFFCFYQAPPLGFCFDLYFATGSMLQEVQKTSKHDLQVYCNITDLSNANKREVWIRNWRSPWQLFLKARRKPPSFSLMWGNWFWCPVLFSLHCIFFLAQGADLSFLITSWKWLKFPQVAFWWLDRHFRMLVFWQESWIPLGWGRSGHPCR